MRKHHEHTTSAVVTMLPSIIAGGAMVAVAIGGAIYKIRGGK